MSIYNISDFQTITRTSNESLWIDCRHGVPAGEATLRGQVSNNHVLALWVIVIITKVLGMSMIVLASPSNPLIIKVPFSRYSALIRTSPNKTGKLVLLGYLVT